MLAKTLTVVALLLQVHTANPIQPPRAQFPDRANLFVQRLCVRVRITKGRRTRVSQKIRNDSGGTTNPDSMNDVA